MFASTKASLQYHHGVSFVAHCPVQPPRRSVVPSTRDEQSTIKTGQPAFVRGITPSSAFSPAAAQGFFNSQKSAIHGALQGASPPAVQAAVFLAGLVTASLFLVVLNLFRRGLERAYTATVGPNNSRKKSPLAAVLALLLNILGVDLQAAARLQKLAETPKLTEELAKQSLSIAMLQKDLKDRETRLAVVSERVEKSEATAAAVQEKSDEKVAHAGAAMSQASRKVTVLEELVDAMKQRLDAEKKRSTDLQAQSEELQSEMSDIRATSSASTTGLQNTLDATVDQLEEARQELQVAKNAIAKLTVDARALQEKRDSAVTKATEETNALFTQTTSASTDAATLQSNISALQSAVEATEVQSSELRERVKAAEGREDSLKGMLAEKEAEMGESGVAVTKMTQEASQLKSELDLAQGALRDMEARIRDAEIGSAELQAQLEDAHESAATATLESAEAIDQRANAEAMIADLQSRLEDEQTSCEAARAEVALMAATVAEATSQSGSNAAALAVEKDAAVAEKEALQLQLNELQSELDEAVHHIFQQASNPNLAHDELRSSLEAVVSTGASVSVWWGLPSSTLERQREEFLRKLAGIRADALKQRQLMRAQLTSDESRELEKLQQSIAELEDRRAGLSIMNVPEHREQKDRELLKEVTEKRRQADSLLMNKAAPALLAQHSVLADELAVLSGRVESLDRALQIPLRERLELLLAYQVSGLRTIVQEELDTKVKDHNAELQQKAAAADSAAEAVLQEAHKQVQDKQAAWNEEVEARAADIEELKLQAASESEARLSEAEAKAAVAAEKLRVANAKEAEAEAKLSRAADLLQAHGPLESVGQRTAELDAQTKQLQLDLAMMAETLEDAKNDSMRMDEENSSLKDNWDVLYKAQKVQATEKASIEAQKAQVEAQLKKLEAEKSDIAAENSRLQEAHASVEKLKGELESQAETAQKHLELERKEKRQQMLIEVAEMRQKLEADMVKDLAEQSEKVKNVDSLLSDLKGQKEELDGLKARYASQFEASQQQLAAAQKQAQELQKEIRQKNERIQTLETTQSTSPQEIPSTPRQPATNNSSPVSTANLEPTSSSSTQSTPTAPSTPTQRSRTSNSPASASPVEPARKASTKSPVYKRSSTPGPDQIVSEVSSWATQLLTNLATPPDRTSTAGTVKLTAGKAGSIRARAAAAKAAPAKADVKKKTVVKEGKLVTAAACIPHPDKIAKGGEDAHFISTSGLGALGIADGVGGWAESGVDPSIYSKQLMSMSKSYLEGHPGTSCLQALDYAHAKNDVQGSATAVLARMCAGTKLEVLNLGDSGLRLLRKGIVKWKTKTLQHEFNMPYQLANAALLPETDFPRQGTVTNITCAPGDIVVMGSDGLFDNVWDDDLERLVLEASESANSQILAKHELQELAESIVCLAERNSLDKMYKSPWSVECAGQRQVGFLRMLFPKGGKLDDITVVVSSVHEQ